MGCGRTSAGMSIPKLDYGALRFVRRERSIRDEQQRKYDAEQRDIADQGLPRYCSSVLCLGAAAKAPRPGASACRSRRAGVAATACPRAGDRRVDAIDAARRRAPS